MSSKSDIFDRVSSSDIFDKISPDVSRKRSLASAPVKGAIKGASSLAESLDPSQLILQNILPKKQDVLKDVTEQVLPTQQKAPEEFLEKAGNLLPAALLGGGGAANAAIQAIAGAALSQVAKEEGIGPVGQNIAEIAGMAIPGIAKAGTQKAISAIKAPIEKLPSGLSKPRAVEAKLVSKGVIGSERQKKALTDLNKEASILAKSTLEKEVPLSKQIQEGVDFESQFEKRFSGLEKVAEKANPDIDVTPLSKFFSETAKKYRGIPKPHPEAVQISKEINAFNKNPQIELKKLLRTYRSNNKKIKSIYETSRLTGKQQEYVDFLVDYNRNIAKSFEKTLPSDSAWIKEFQDTNKFYKQYKDAQKSIHLIEPILDEKVTPSTIQKFAQDKRLQKKLELAMGKNGADQIIQIAKDLNLASNSIRNIPVKELKIWDGIFPLSVLIPNASIPGGVITAKKSLDWARRGYGWFLSSNSRRKSYDQALKAINEGNQSSYIKASQSLQDSLKEESD